MTKSSEPESSTSLGVKRQIDSNNVVDAKKSRQDGDGLSEKSEV